MEGWVRETQAREVQAREGSSEHGALLQIKGLSVRRQNHDVLRAISLEIHSRERVSIEGAIGSGKSTLLWAIMGLIERQAGEIQIFSKPCVSEPDFAQVRGHIALMFQDPDDQLIGPTVLEDLEFGPLNLGVDRRQSRDRAREVLSQLGIEALAERAVGTLSGGQKRLVALAGVMALEPRLLLLDEPTASLDRAAAERMVEVLASLPCALVLASHDPLCIEALSTRRLTLREGALA